MSDINACVDAGSMCDVPRPQTVAGIMLRAVMPTMAKAPTLAMWGLEQLRMLENVVTTPTSAWQPTSARGWHGSRAVMTS